MIDQIIFLSRIFRSDVFEELFKDFFGNLCLADHFFLDWLAIGSLLWSTLAYASSKEVLTTVND